MRKTVLFIVVFLLSKFIFSQSLEVIPFTGYMFGGHIKYIEGKINIDDGQNYGISICTPVKGGIVDLELNYTRMGSNMSFSPYSGFGYHPVESHLETNYFQIGGIKKVEIASEKIIPFGSFSLGATWFDSSEFNDVWRFSAILGAGIKFMFSEKVGIIARGRLMMPMEFAGIGFYVGTGGSGLNTNSYITPVQGDFSVGLVFKIGK